MAEVHGFTHDRFAGVRPIFENNLDSGADLGASFAATLEGEMVVDIWGGYADPARKRAWEKDTIVNVYSTTKTMTALTALLLADRGELDFEAPVARYWPEFAAAGKAGVKVSHLMSHAAGLSGWKEPITVETLYDWEKATALLAAQAPFWEPGTASGYHAITQGYLVGEVVRRITGKSLGTVFREEIAEPLGADFHIGLPASEDARVAELIPPPAGQAMGDGEQTELQRNMSHNPGRGRLRDENQGVARCGDPGGGRHGQCARGGADPHHPGQRRRGEGQALHVRGRVQEGARVADRGARPDPVGPRALWHGLRPGGRHGSPAQSGLHVLGRLWRLHRHHRHGCAHHLLLRHEQDGGDDDG